MVIENAALWVCEHGAENLARYCAEGDAAIYASYLKTLDFVVDFAVKHGVCGALNKKLATANGYSARQFNLNKPHEFRSGKTSGGVKYSERVVRVYGRGRFWESLTTSETDGALRNLKNKSKTREDVGFDGRFYYQFDPNHQHQKVHLHKYKKVGSNGYQLIAEVDPETGVKIKDVKGKIEYWK